jgi:hypothetical protein
MVMAEDMKGVAEDMRGVGVVVVTVSKIPVVQTNGAEKCPLFVAEYMLHSTLHWL